MFGAVLFIGFCIFVIVLCVGSALPQSENPTFVEFIPFIVMVAITLFIGYFLFSTVGTV